ncbi:E3 ubiquitin-protein ligase PRT6 [Impatiens glandulifera]|uniref:E3 ubiquitin-protein ligase PRT6 n=1 Tax=Impatiens glandulifera TaxID=253017 RepID=UPI001FB16955|nr:E3 ubiquitin-protein ligase PRT6 [Impatiens glandulifera]
MFRMEIDSSLELDALSPQDCIIQRLTALGVPVKNLEKLQPGLISFIKNNKNRIPELVSAILPSDEEAVAISDSNLADYFSESLVWCQWLMFEGNPNDVLQMLAENGGGGRGVCGAVWGNNDIAYRCRTCEHDPTCAICVPCFQNGSHADHDYSIIYTGGGCCDCGDITAWKRDGFCSKHKGAEEVQPLSDEIAKSIGPVLDSLLVCWRNKLMVAETVSKGSPRVKAHVSEWRTAGDLLTSSVLDMLLDFCQYSESLLSFISGRVWSSVGLLDILVKVESWLSDDNIKKLHELFLKLLGDPSFKYEFAKVFVSYYPTLVGEAIKQCSDNIFKRFPLISTFSVQIFTVPTLTPRLVKEQNLLGMLLECLGDIFVSCAGEDGRLQVSKWGNLYETTLRVVEDTRFVISHAVVPRYVTRERRDILKTWMRLLAFVQGMNPLKRETNIHVEEENDTMHLPFVLCHSIGNIHTLLVTEAFSSCGDEDMDDENRLNLYNEDQDNLRHAKVGKLSQESSVCSSSLRGSYPVPEFTDEKFDLLLPSSVSWFIFECLKAIENWLGVDNTSGPLDTLLLKTSNLSGNDFFALRKTLSRLRRGKSFFKLYNNPPAYSKLTTESDLQSVQYFKPAQGRLHASTAVDGRQVTGSNVFDDSIAEKDCGNELEDLSILCLSEWPNIAYDVSSRDVSVHIPLHRLLSLVLQKALGRCYGEDATTTSSTTDFFAFVLGGCHPCGFSAYVMEHPLRIKVFCAEVHAGMWKRNGDTAILFYEWYRSVRWSEQGLELDLFLLQCCAALAPPDLFINRIVERFELSNYLSLSLQRSSEYEPVLVQSMLTLIIQIIKERRFCGLTVAECLQRELIYKLALGDATHSQLVKSLPRDLSKMDQLQGILDKVAVYSRPSGMNQGMYKLRLQYWKELDLYHPRWNSRDLQVAEERYLRFCKTPAFTTQLPQWSKIYKPLTGIAGVATCKGVLEIVRAVMFYAVFTDKATPSRAPDGVLLTALHFISLALDVCINMRKADDISCNLNNSVPIVAFATQEVSVGFPSRSSDQSLLSLLVALMKTHKKENSDVFMEAGTLNLSSLIENLLKKFAEIDPGCMVKLQKLAPEIIDHLSQSLTISDAPVGVSISDVDKRKAKARERQAAMLEKMRAQQSKFLESITSTPDEGMGDSRCEEESSDAETDSSKSTRAICSLCRDPKSESPLSFLILLQKSKLMGLVDRGPPLWEQDCQPMSFQTADENVQSSDITELSVSEGVSLPSLNQLIQTPISVLASEQQHDEVDALVKFIRARFPSINNIQLPHPTKQLTEKASWSPEMFEEHLYLSIREKMLVFLHPNNSELDGKLSDDEGTSTRNIAVESIFLGKYVAALSRDALETPSSSETSNSGNRSAESSTLLPACDGLRPSGCDGVYLSSCGHAVHLACLDLYLSSLKERYNRRIVFEGGHIVNPDQGEFLCPVCRGLANAVLPALPVDTLSDFKTPVVEDNYLDVISPLTSSKGEIVSLRLRGALALIRAASSVCLKSETLKAVPVHQNGSLNLNMDSMIRVLSRIYSPGKHDKLSGSPRLSHSLILWDTLRYSLMSTEIAARCGKSSLAPNHDLTTLFKELKSSSGFILALLLKTVQLMRSKSSLSALQRLKGIQLFEESICSGSYHDQVSSSTSMKRGDVLSILEHVEGGWPSF